MTSGYADRAKSEVVELADRAPISKARVVLAFVLTPLFASLVVALAMPLYAGLTSYSDRVLRSWPVYAVFGAAPATLVFGIPAFLLLKKLVRPTIIWCGLAGALVAALPWFFVGLLAGPDQAWTDDHATILNGHYTLYGWLEFGWFLLMTASAGAVGGAIFWMIAAAKFSKRPG